MGYLNVPYQQHNTPTVYQTNADEHKTPKQSILASRPAGQQVYTPLRLNSTQISTSTTLSTSASTIA